MFARPFCLSLRAQATCWGDIWLIWLFSLYKLVFISLLNWMNCLVLLSLWGWSLSDLDWAANFGTPRGRARVSRCDNFLLTCYRWGWGSLWRLSTLSLTALAEIRNLGSETTPGTWKWLSYLSSVLPPSLSSAAVHPLCFLWEPRENLGV